MGALERSPKPPTLQPPAEPRASASATPLSERNRRTLRVLLAIVALLIVSALLVGIRW